MLEKRSRLRVLVASVDRELLQMAEKHELAAAWAELVGLLALGPKPKFRVCPSCKNVGMLDATRCGYCWSLLSRLPEDEKASA